MINKGNSRLKIICQKNLENLSYINRRLYPLFYCEDLWVSAYEKLKKGAIKVSDGFSLEKIYELIQLFREEKWNPKPNILKLGKKALGIPEEKIVQEILQRILESIYEPLFLDLSYGFRPNKSHHSALSDIEKKFQGMFWIIKGDIRGCTIPHLSLINVLRKRICDEKFFNLMWKLLRAGYFVEVLTPQRRRVFPLLTNIYLNELDHWVTDLRDQLDDSKVRTQSFLPYRIEKSLKTDRWELVRKNLKNKYSNQSKRIQYVRYADDWLIGIYGPKSMATEIKNQLSDFLLKELGLNLNKEKIMNVRQKCVIFLGYYIKITTNRKIFHNGKQFLKRGQLVKMLVPMDRIINRLYQKGFCDNSGFPISQKKWSNQDDIEIIRSFRSILYGLMNYYSGVSYQHVLGRIDYILRYSCAKTLAHKHNSSCKKIFKKFGKELTIPNTSVSLKKNQYINKRKRWQNSSQIHIWDLVF